jgi:hypothetical protein
MSPEETNKWTFEGKPFTQDMVGKWAGFVYRITLPDGRKYIGKKGFWSQKRKDVVKKGVKKLEQKKGLKVKDLSEEEKESRTKTVKSVAISDWESYYSSSDLIKQMIQNGKKGEFRREILQLCPTKGTMSYFELLWQLKEDALLRSDYLNGIINVRLGRNVFPKDMIDEADRKAGIVKAPAPKPIIREETDEEWWARTQKWTTAEPSTS